MSRLFRDVDGGSLYPRGSVVCIGAFDGLHLGHRALVRHAVARAQALGLPAVALSFEPLPREFFARGNPPPRLTLPRDRVQALLALGIDRLGLLRFNTALAAMPADEFVRRVLAGRLDAREVWIGPEFRFGNRRGGDLALLRAMGQELGFAAGEIAPVHVEGERVSSTRIREALRAGDFDQAARLLGRPYAIGGRVVRGRQLGRTLGYPTANLRFPKTPALSGIYATWVHGAGLQPLPSVASFGTRPTVDGVEPLLEAHLFDFAGDLYGRHLQVEFVAKLRDEEKFADLESLTVQMHRDAAQARRILAGATVPAPPVADADDASSLQDSAHPRAADESANPSEKPARPRADPPSDNLTAARR
ncbi:bifunctional riboflavin kinase/FAD synthetase [Pseudoxanthomonas sp. Soil82]|uniref:bifunctional riboflavin kinase/FAD synthetase n=1 Tax=Pseudoxanthomonas sp. Soil82 TaxID=3157341 RepID=UPI0033905CA2